MRILLLLLVLLGSPLSAREPDSEQACRDDPTPCYLRRQDHFLDAFGLSPATTLRDSGVQIRRVMIFGRMVNPVVAVEFRRAPGHEPIVSIYGRNPEAAPPGPAEPAYSAAVPLADWERITASGQNFDRDLVPRPPEIVRIEGQIAITVCADGGLDIVETTDPGAQGSLTRLRTRAQNTCDQGLANDYANVLVATAQRLLPACATLDQAADSPERGLADCTMLAGDRIAAAQAHNRLRTLRYPNSAGELRYLFDEGVVLDWSGTAARGAPAAADVWFHNTHGDPNYSFFPRALTGETQDRVRVEGLLEYWSQDSRGEPVLLNAPVHLLLTRVPYQEFQIAEASVETFRQAAHFCDPRYLVLRCR